MTQEHDEMGTIDANSDTMRAGAAVFLAEVLELRNASVQLAEDLSEIKRDANAAIFTIQLDSSVGPAAFLVYAYLLKERGGDGHTGKELFELGLATLRQAAQHETPGPRAVAHAEEGEVAFILATTPGTYRALAGKSEPDNLEATTANLLPVQDATAQRGEHAQALLQSLTSANEQATDWLHTIQLATQSANGGELLDDRLKFNEDETELALFLLDSQSIGNLLRVLNLLVSTTQHRAQASVESSN